MAGGQRLSPPLRLCLRGPGSLSLGFVSTHPAIQAARQPGRPLSAAVDSERVYQYARRTPCMNVCFLVALGGMGRVAVCGGVSGCLLDQGSLDV